MRVFLLFILVGITKLLMAYSVEQMVNCIPKKVTKIELNQLSKNQIYIANPFAKPIIINPEQKKILQEKVVLKIELVYTQFKTSKLFNQQQLNYQRIIQLKKLLPKLFETPLWNFELIEQTDGHSREFCNNMFHGFIITYRPSSNKNTLEKEADYIDDFVTTILVNDSIINDSTPKSYHIKTHFDNKLGYLHDTIWYIDTLPKPLPPNVFYQPSLYHDSTVLNSFKRNRSWDNFIVVTDVTGSMSPYIAQVFEWLKEQTDNKQAKFFVFFNDGDNKLGNQKKPLETEGIYSTKNTGIKKVKNTAIKCMKNGSGGGEGIENDIEAIIEGIKLYPAIESVLLIADNYESMRAYEFIKKITKPVHIILCGSENRINIQYLDMAYQTKGSIHTKTSDIYNLHLLKNGQKINIDDKEYLFENNKFHHFYEQFNYQNKTLRN